MEIDPIGLSIGYPEILHGTFQLLIHKFIAEERDQGQMELGVMFPMFKSCLFVWFVIIGLQNLLELVDILHCNAIPMCLEISTFHDGPVFSKLDNVILAERDDFIAESGNAFQKSFIA